MAILLLSCATSPASVLAQAPDFARAPAEATLADASALLKQAAARFDAGDKPNAADLLGQALAICKRLEGAGSRDVMVISEQRASVLDDLGRPAEAVPLYDDAVRNHLALDGQRHPSTLLAMSNYGYALGRSGRFAEAEPVFAQVVQLRREVLGAGNPDTLASIENYIGILEKLGKIAFAEPLVRDDLAQRSATQGASAPQTLDALDHYASLLVKLGGGPGGGKSHLASAIGLALIENGWRTLFTRTSDLVQKLQVARRELSLESAIAKLDKYHLLILDDLAYVSKDQAETSVLFELISARHERRSTLITANQPFGDWSRVFPDPAMTLAAVDRIVHHSTIFEMNVDSYRRRTALQRKQEGPGRPPSRATINDSSVLSRVLPHEKVFPSDDGVASPECSLSRSAVLVHSLVEGARRSVAVGVPGMGTGLEVKVLCGVSW